MDTDASSSANPVEPSDFTNISLEGDPEHPPKKKTPRRLIYCSDGVLEEYSTDEEEEKPPEPEINPKELNWLPWFWYYIVNTARGTLYVADTCGEKLAWFFGITTPKYQYAIDEYYRLKEEEEREKAKEKRDQEMFEEKKLSQVRVDTPQKLDITEETKEQVTKY
ncbi:protein FAM177A1-like [Saccostrea echinata]|uniref:protein FAM177A1-like n=1 Tax=Saccostrea echinata TaxID=191078 RepID=UPI002A824509|nr:protein FAM177A1-like [Saccostrea echinata]